MELDSRILSSALTVFVSQAKADSTGDPPSTLRRWRHDSQAKRDSGIGALHRPCVGGGTTFKLSETRGQATLHRPWVGGGTTFKLSETRGPVPSTDRASVEARFSSYARLGDRCPPPTLRRWGHDFQAK